MAKACGVPRTRIERIAAEKLGISGNTAVHLAAFFGTTPEFWMNLQIRYELLTAQAAIVDETARIKPHARAAA